MICAAVLLNPVFQNKSIGCPMRANKKELEDNPRYAFLYKKAAGRFLETKANTREGNKKDVETYYKWWVDFCGGKRTEEV